MMEEEQGLIKIIAVDHCRAGKGKLKGYEEVKLDTKTSNLCVIKKGGLVRE